MNYDELPEWTLPYFDNFTGPYWSDGKFQGSTSKSKKKPITKLDYLSRDHDCSYALCESLECLDDADWDYYVRSRKMSLGPRIIGTLPLLGNAPLRSVYKALGTGYRGIDVEEKMVSKNVERFMNLSPKDKNLTWVMLTAKERREYEHIKRLERDAQAEEAVKAEALVAKKKYDEAKAADRNKDNPKETKDKPETTPTLPVVTEPPKTPVVTTLPDVGSTPAVVDRRDQKTLDEPSQYNPYALDLSKLRGMPFRNPWFNGPGALHYIRAKKPKKKKKNRIYVAY